VRRLTERYGTREPFALARASGARVVFADLGSLKGMYTYILRNRFIVVNPNLAEYMQKLVCAHELGHDQLHRQEAANRVMREFMLYNMKQRPEYEANVFAAELLLPDERVLELSASGLDIKQISRVLCTDVNLVAIKLSALAERGYVFRQFDYRSDFLKPPENGVSR
jgi:Zn-dependent peptidase ImmA (M78 family)